MSETHTAGPTENETLKGFTRVEVEHTKGIKELVEVKQFTMRELDRYFGVEKNGDLSAMAEIFTGKKAGWADGLTHDSIYKVVEEGQRVNRNPFKARAQFQQRQSAWVGELLAEASPKPAGSPESA